MASRLMGEEKHKRSATSQVEQWLHDLGISTKRPGVPFFNIQPASPSLQISNHSLRQGLWKPVKVVQERRIGETVVTDQRRRSRRGNEFEGGGRTIHDNGGQAAPIANSGVVQGRNFDVHEQLKEFPSSNCPQFLRIHSLVDWASSDWKRATETIKSNRTAALHHLHLTLWRQLTKRLSDLYQRQPLPERCTPSPPRRTSFIKNAFYHTQEFSLAANRKILYQRGSELMRNTRLISLQKLLRKHISTSDSQTCSNSTTPVHMHTEGNNGSRSESPQFMLASFEPRKTTATCIGFKTYRFERVGRIAYTRSIHQIQQMEKLPYVVATTAGEERRGPLIKFRTIRKRRDLLPFPTTVQRDDLDTSFKQKPEQRTRKRSALPSPIKPINVKRTASQRPVALITKGKRCSNYT